MSARGTFAEANAFARSVGLRDRHQLAYTLRRDGLRSLRTLAGWIRVAVWAAETEFQGASLCHAALAESQDPSARYRLVKRLTGVEWTQVEARGLTWLVEELVRHCVLSVEHAESVDGRRVG